MTEALVQVDNLGLRRRRRWVLQQVSFSIHERQIVTVIGPNGAGKSTLVKAVLGLLRYQQGQIVRRPQLRVGYMPQKLTIDPHLPMTVQRFLQLASRCKTDVANAMAELGITYLAAQPLAGCSGGEVQRVLLARALLRRPQLLVLDEPVQGVDVAGQAELYRLIGDIRSQHGCSVLMVSHDLHWVMAATDQVICLNRHVCCQGHPEQVSADPAYFDLFGDVAASQLAHYTHHHDHCHDMAGRVVDSDAN